MSFLELRKPEGARSRLYRRGEGSKITIDQIENINEQIQAKYKRLIKNRPIVYTDKYKYKDNEGTPYTINTYALESNASEHEGLVTKFMTDLEMWLVENKGETLIEREAPKLRGFGPGQSPERFDCTNIVISARLGLIDKKHRYY